MTDRQHNMLSEMKRGIKDALSLIEEVKDIEALHNTAEEVGTNYIGRLYQLAFMATIEVFYEKNG